MQTITELFGNIGPWAWFVVAVLMFLLETVIPGIHFMWFGVAAIVVFGLTLVVDMPLTWQVIVFALVSIASVYWVRHYIRPGSEATDQPGLNIKGAEYIGRTFVVEEAIEGGRGKIRVGDTIWTAQGPSSPSGAKVRVTGSSGTVLVVEPA
jgi:inner membrane protein